MLFFSRAATSLAVLFSAVSLGTSAPGYALQLQNQSIQGVNAPEPKLVPALQTVQPQRAQTDDALPAPAPAVADAETDQDTNQDDAEFASLNDAVESQQVDATLDDDTNCLAVGIYYEAKSEPLAGQLAVANVILNRAASGRFPRSVCGVLKQAGQFSFVRRGALPTPPQNAQWRKAVAVAQVAQKELWSNPVPKALYFHASFVKAGGGRTQIAQLGNHIFYR